MVAAALIIGGAGVIGAGVGAVGASEAADAQKDAATASRIATEKQYQQTREDLGPFRDIGVDSTALIADIYGFNGPEAQEWARGQFRSDPGYEFQRDEGLRAVEGSAAARGSALSGGTLKALQQYGTGLADQSYGQWYSRLAGQQSIGENAAAQTGNFGAQAAGNISNAYGQYGAAQAGGALGVGNAITGSLSDAMKSYGYAKGQGWLNSGGGQYGDGYTAWGLN